MPKEKQTMSFVIDKDNRENIKKWADKWAISNSVVINVILRSFFENVEKVLNEQSK